MKRAPRSYQNSWLVGLNRISFTSTCHGFCFFRKLRGAQTPVARGVILTVAARARVLIIEPRYGLLRYFAR